MVYYARPTSGCNHLDIVGHRMTVTQAIGTDAALQVLADKRRRQVLLHLAKSNGSTTIDELVEAVFTNTSSPRNPDEVQEQIKLNLHHNHLPRLQDTGLIEYDPSGQTIQYYPDDHVKELLQVCSSK